MSSSRRYLQESLWANDIRIRDGNKCVICGSPNTLQVHHIYGVKDYGFLFSDTSNGITLCKECHQKYHQLYDEVNPYTWTKYILKNEWNASTISIKYNNGSVQEIPLFDLQNNINEHKPLIGGNVRSTVIHITQTSGFENGITPIDWIKLYANQVYGIEIREIEKEINYLIQKGLFEKIGKMNVRFSP